jgi:hypothetical protein
MDEIESKLSVMALTKPDQKSTNEDKEAKMSGKPMTKEQRQQGRTKKSLLQWDEATGTVS